MMSFFEPVVFSILPKWLKDHLLFEDGGYLLTCTLFLPKSCKWNRGPANITFVSFRAMFHFHDSGRKGISKAVVKFTFNWFYPRGKLAYPIKQEKENHFQLCLGMGHVRSQEGMILDQGGGFKCFFISPLGSKTNQL